MPHEPLYGVLGEFATAEALLGAVEELRRAGFSSLETYTPYPVEALAEATGATRHPVALLTLAGGLTGGIGGFVMQWYAATVSYPIDVGSRPYYSWPAFIPVTFELTVLCAGLTAAFSMLALNRLPRLHHPVFEAAAFRRASLDGFFICVRCQGAEDRRYAEELLQKLQSRSITEVPDVAA